MIYRLYQKIRNKLSTHLVFKAKTTLLPFLSSVDQKTLTLLYKQQLFGGGPPQSFRDVGFRVHSQHEEDGILLYIFALIGVRTFRCVEICAGDGIECNTANLILNHRWIGLLCDGNEKNIEKARKFYQRHPDSKFWPPVITKKWITKDNVNDILESKGFSGEIDLLSLDIDGVDYWVWKEISCVSPRVVVLEFNHLWGPEASVTVPYKENFTAEFTTFGSDYAGASLKAFIKLGKEKGYRFVGANAIATNAFFIRNDIECDWLTEVDMTGVFDHPRAQFGIKERLPAIKENIWIDV